MRIGLPGEVDKASPLHPHQARVLPVVQLLEQQFEAIAALCLEAGMVKGDKLSVDGRSSRSTQQGGPNPALQLAEGFSKPNRATVSNGIGTAKPERRLSQEQVSTTDRDAT
jgi:hypothetical protein